MDKKSQSAFIITLVFFIAMIGYASYATIAPVISPTETSTSSSTGGRLAFTSSGGSNVTLHVAQNNMYKTDGSLAASTNANVNIVLETDGLKKVCCSYKLKWNWASGVTYTKSSGTTANEITAVGNLSAKYKNSSNSLVAITVTGNPMFTSQLPNSSSSDKTIYTTTTTTEICNKNSSVLSKYVLQTWNIAVNVYSLGVNQDALLGKSLTGSVAVDEVNCSKRND